MSEMFTGLDGIRAAAEKVTASTGIEIQISTVSSESTPNRPGCFAIDRGHLEAELARLFDSYAPNRDKSWRDYGEDFENDIFWVHYDRQDLPGCSCQRGRDSIMWKLSNTHKGACFINHIVPLVNFCKELNPVPDLQNHSDMGPASLMRFKQMMFGGDGPTETDIATEREQDIAHHFEISQYQIALAIQNKAVRKLVMKEAKSRGIVKGQSVELEFKNADWMYEYLCTCGYQTDESEWERSHEHCQPCEHWWANQPNFLFKPSGYALHWYKYPCRDSYANQDISLQQISEIIDSCITSVGA